MEARAQPAQTIEPIEPVEPTPNIEEDVNNNLPVERPAEPREDDTGVNGDKPAPNVEAAPEEAPVMPPR